MVSFEDLDVAETVMFFGHNPAETGTVFFDRVMERKEKTGKPYIIVVDPRETLTARHADLHLQLQPGTNVPLMNGLLREILHHGQVDQPFIEEHTIHYEEMKDSLEGWSFDQTSGVTRIPVSQLQEAARQLGHTKSLVSTTLQGTFQSSDATAACVAINNMHLARGLIGKPGSGPLHMAGQPSSSGNRTVGGVGTYPGNRNPENPDHLQDIADLWNVEQESLPVGGAGKRNYQAVGNDGKGENWLFLEHSYQSAGIPSGPGTGTEGDGRRVCGGAGSVSHSDHGRG